ncbi:MAG: diguanylate cyclase with sensor [Frankiales bacterium]|nr:diguanylate cyclase with sensor [Frankiales bacterium]
MTLRTRLTAAFVLVVLVPLLVGGLVVLRALPASTAARQAETVTTSARLVATVLAGYCDRARATAEAAARATAGTPGPATRRVVRELVSSGLADGVRVVSREGATIALAGRAPAISEVVDCSRGVAGSTPHLASVVRLTTSAGQPAGTAIASFVVDDAFAARLRGAVGHGQVALLAAERVLARSGPLPDALVRSTLRSQAQVDTIAGQVGMLAPSRPGQPYAVLVALPAARAPGLLLVTLVVIGGAVLLAALIAWLLARLTTQPLEDLGDAAARVAAGDLDTTIEVRSRDEVGRLATAFNGMTEELRRYVGALEASRDELQAGLARLGDTLSSTHDLDRMLAVVLETAMASTGAQAGMVLLLGPDRDELVLSVARGMQERGVPEDLRVALGVGISGRVAQTGEAVLGQAGDGPGQLRPGPDEPNRGSVIAVPLMGSGTVVGVLDLYDRRDADGFDERDLATIRTFASQATVAVDNVLLHEEAQRLSVTDGLTGLWNYRYFTMTVAKEIERSSRFGRPLALLMLDLDHFKKVNDTLGHQRGDAVLVELAARVRAEVRDVDTVARYGGEEVVVILPETDAAGAAQAAERICEAVRRDAFGEPGQVPVEVTVSVGAAVFPAHGGDAADLLRCADEALYEAKRTGRDTWRVATPSTSAATGVPPAS